MKGDRSLTSRRPRQCFEQARPRPRPKEGEGGRVASGVVRRVLEGAGAPFRTPALGVPVPSRPVLGPSWSHRGGHTSFAAQMCVPVHGCVLQSEARYPFLGLCVPAQPCTCPPRGKFLAKGWLPHVNGSLGCGGNRGCAQPPPHPLDGPPV